MKAIRLLWVEDEFNDLRGLVRPLQLQGFTVDFAADYESARAILDKGERFDLFIIDIIIPELNVAKMEFHDKPRENVGLDLMKDIRGKYKLTSVPIIVLSVVTQQQVLNKARQLGATILTKGVMSPSELESEVKSALGIAPSEVEPK